MMNLATHTIADKNIVIQNRQAEWDTVCKFCYNWKKTEELDAMN